MYLTERQIQSLSGLLAEIDSSIGDPGFPEHLLHSYLSYFHLDYCHLAHPDDNYVFIIHEDMGYRDELVRVYREHEEHCVFKNESLRNIQCTTTLHLDLERWEILTQINPLYDALSRHFKGVEIISALHPDSNGLVGLRLDGSPIPDNMLAEHQIISPHCINAYHQHCRLTAHRDMEEYLYGIVKSESGAVFALCDQAFRIVVTDCDFHGALNARGIHWSDLALALLKEHNHERRFADSFVDKVFSIAIQDLTVRAEPVIVEGRAYFRVDIHSDQGRVSLTPREREIYQLIRAGCSNRDIAEQLLISSETVKRHIANLFQKAGAKNRTKLSRMVL